MITTEVISVRLITKTDTAVWTLSISIDCVDLLLFKCELRCDCFFIVLEKLFLPGCMMHLKGTKHNHYLRTFKKQKILLWVLKNTFCGYSVTFFMSLLCLVSTLLKEIAWLIFSRCCVRLLSFICHL